MSSRPAPSPTDEPPGGGTPAGFPRAVNVLDSADRHARLRPDPDHRARLRAWDGSPRAHDWTPLPVTLVTADDDGPLATSDCPSLGGAPPAFSARAVEVLRDLLEPHGELLPLACDDGEFWAYNCTRVVDALDEDASEVVRFRSSGRVNSIVRHVLRPAELTNVPVFRLASAPDLYTYVTDAFTEHVTSAGLIGFAPRPVWEAHS